MADPYLVWRNPNYRLYAVSWFLMTFGRMIETLTIRAHVYDLTHDPMSLGWIGLVQATPVLLLASPGGQIADRFDRRRVLMLMLVLNTLVTLGLLAVTYHQGSVPWIYTLLTLGAIGQALGSPSRAALLPQIVGVEIFANAVTWNSSVFQIASMTGPAIGGVILSGPEWLRWVALHFHNTAIRGVILSIPTGVTGALAAVVAFRVMSLAAMWGVKTERVVRTEAVTLESLVRGIRFVWETKLILATISLDLFAVLLGGATYLLPVFAKDILHVGKLGLGLLQSAEAVGAVVMAVLLTHLPPMKRAGRTMLWAVAAFGAATIVFGLSRWFPLSLAMMFLIGSVDNVSVVVRHTLVQMLTPDVMRGRVSAVNNIFIVASNDLGGLESGFTARLFGAVPSVVLGGIGAIGVVLAAAARWPQILTIGSLKDVRPVEPSTATTLVPDELPDDEALA
jgi:MFS family permease